jgi:hypothetical protein
MILSYTIMAIVIGVDYETIGMRSLEVLDSIFLPTPHTEGNKPPA